MESVVMASPSGARFRSRWRSAASSFLSRASKGRQTNNARNNNNHKGNRNQHSKSYSPRNTGNRNGNGPNNNNGDETVSNAIQTTSMSANNNINNLHHPCRGPFTREVYKAISGRLGQTLNIPGDSVQPLFNDIRLYPSNNEVSEMLQCARQCSQRNGAPYLTFGEFCLFAREMQTNHRMRRPSQKPKKCTNNCEVFLGGSCNPTTWRIDTAIPELQKHGISYYNPQVPMWAPELVAEEHNAKQSASVLLFVVDSQTRSVSGMIEVAYLVASGRCVILVVNPYSLGQSIMGEVITKRECYDLVGGQTTLLALVKSKGIKVHNSLSAAIQCTTRLLRNTAANNGISAEEQITWKLRKLREIFDYYDHNQTGELPIEDVVNAYFSLTDRNIKPYTLYNYLNTTNNDRSSLRFSFEHFCALVAEFSVDGSENFNSNAWAGRPLQRQYSRNNNSNVDDVGKQTTRLGNDIFRRSAGRERFLADVFLGGSCRGTHGWRDQAIPIIKSQGLTYYNPAVRETAPEYNNVARLDNTTFYRNESSCDSLNESTVLQWRRAIDKSRVLLFVITNDTRSLTTMILAAYYIGLGKDVVLCVQHLVEEDSEIGNEKLTQQAIKDYNRGRVYLTDLAKRKHVSVFENITTAVQCAIETCRNR